MFDFRFGVTSGHVVYDIETYPNAFTIALTHDETGKEWEFEVSEFKDEYDIFLDFIRTLQRVNAVGVGFNSLGFDYPVIHFAVKHSNMLNMMPTLDKVDTIYQHAMKIIKAPDHAKFSLMVKESDWLFPQVDLFKVHHFDNKAKSTSLKVLEFNMRSENLEDLPYEPGTILTADQIPVLKSYNRVDTTETLKFFNRSKSAVDLRQQLSETFGRNMMNMSDVKIGETLLVMELKKRGIYCYTRDGKKKQTKRESINLGEVIFPYVQFERSEFNTILEYFQTKVITETKGVFQGLVAQVEGLDYAFGTGGLHASLDNTIIESTDDYQIVDVDVASFYPNLGIQNRLYPAHLGPEFCEAYLGLYHTRKTYKKGTPENEAYKLALNGAYGGSNNEYSPFFDPFYTMSITINGQLSLCMLVEQLIKVPGLKMIQANTDGVTYLCPRVYLDHTRSVCRWWEQVTKLELEEALYSRMWIRDVNSYIAEKEGGKLKRIGAYAHETAEENPGTRELPYHKDWSSRVVALAAEAALVRGTDIEDFITHHQDDYNFLLRTKVPRSSQLEWGGTRVPNTIRYYISTDGDYLEKVMPAAGPEGEFKRANKIPDWLFNQVMAEIGPGVWDPRVHTKNKSKYEERRTRLHDPFNVRICNRLSEHDFSDVNYDWYIREAEKLVKPLRRL